MYVVCYVRVMCYVFCDMLCVMCVLCVMCSVICCVLCVMILGIDPKFGLSILWSNSKIFSNRLILIYFKIKIFFI